MWGLSTGCVRERFNLQGMATVMADERRVRILQVERNFTEMLFRCCLTRMISVKNQGAIDCQFSTVVLLTENFCYAQMFGYLCSLEKF